ncbi:hypothetical protein K4F52_002955 [Lecanicillium sp. MT-2017a]|nr:hypothetical protein K4F52_002955 [Lecanicillium sp. MT-2017a]
MSIDSKPKPSHREQSDDSSGSTPEGEQNAVPNAQDAQPQPKRKGGRKPIYATSEERKQRNRQAQAAFRERRTEYIKQLEETIRVHESNLHNLQSAHRNAADECLMLRYKNSLLERILLEKGIDVHAELQAKTGSPTLGPTHMPQNIVQPPPIHRSILSRSRKSISAIAPKVDAATTGSSASGVKREGSPKSRSTPAAHSNSPGNSAAAFSPSPGDTSLRNASVSSGQQMPQISGMAPSQPLMPGNQHRGSMSGSGASFYATPSFQNHLDQLEEEYDVQAELLEDSEMENANPRTFSGNFGGDALMMTPTSNASGQGASATSQAFPPMSSLMEQNLDWDPFGLSASMTFPTQQFQFDQTQMR